VDLIHVKLTTPDANRITLQIKQWDLARYNEFRGVMKVEVGGEAHHLAGGAMACFDYCRSNLYVLPWPLPIVYTIDGYAYFNYLILVSRTK
jgi:hypothetical protein